MWQIFKLINLFYFFANSFVWWSFGFNRNLMGLLVNLAMIVCLMLCKFKLNISRRSLHIFIIIVILSLATTILLRSVASFILVNLCIYLPALYLYMLPKSRKRDLLLFTTKWYSIILGISICVFILNGFINIPSLGVFEAGDLDYPPYDNYLFFIKTRMYDKFVYRFNGPFLEPGHQAMISCLLLFSNKYNFNDCKYLWILLAAIVISFSLAGYVMLVLGYIFLKVHSISKVLLFGITLLIAHFFITDVWNNGGNPINVLIFERLEYDKEKGITGNNRTYETTDEYFDQCVKDGTIILGIRGRDVGKNNTKGAGYKIYLLKYGVISLIIISMFYLLLIPPRCNKRYAYFFFLLLLIVFLQRAYPYWYSWMFPYVIGIGITVKSKTRTFKIQDENSLRFMWNKS